MQAALICATCTTLHGGPGPMPKCQGLVLTLANHKPQTQVETAGTTQLSHFIIAREECMPTVVLEIWF